MIFSAELDSEPSALTSRIAAYLVYPCSVRGPQQHGGMCGPCKHVLGSHEGLNFLIGTRVNSLPNADTVSPRASPAKCQMTCGQGPLPQLSPGNTPMGVLSSTADKEVLGGPPPSLGAPHDSLWPILGWLPEPQPQATQVVRRCCSSSASQLHIALLSPWS